MKFAPTRRSGRPGFTLIEILVVIAIIAILASMIAAAVMKFMLEGPRAETRAEMVSLTAALEKFKSENGFYPPSRLMLHDNGAWNTNGTQLEQDSLDFMQRLMQRAYQRNPNTGLWPAVNWNGSYTNAGAVTLEGDECLVFFLQGPNGQGFQLAGNVKRGPYFTFQAGRIQTSQNAAGTAPRNAFGYKNYLDPFGHPYAYCSSGKTTNQYNTYGATDCPTLGVTPYFNTVNNVIQYYNPSSYQIISAGTNKLFGPGGQWSPQSAQTINANGVDDMTNFYPSLMSVPQTN